MAKRIITPFAEQGDKDIISESPIGLDVNWQTGYPQSYEEDPGTPENPNLDARFVERDKTNQLLNDITSNIKEWQESAYPDFILPSNNGGIPFPYRKGAVVSYNGLYYISLNGSNTTIPTSNNWDLYIPEDTQRILKLKIFQSPTDNLTKIETFAGSAGVVYEVRKASDNSLATIYSDSTGTNEIPQNGISNVSGLNAECLFYIEDTFDEFKITISASEARFRNDVFIQQYVNPLLESDSRGFGSDTAAIVEKPTGFNLDLDYNVLFTPNGFTTDFNFLAKRKTGLPSVYVDYENGNDSNDGTKDQPLKTLTAAINSSPGNVDVNVFGGLHRYDSIPQTPVNKSFNLIAVDPNDRPRITNTEAATWTKTAGQTNVYESSFTQSPLYWSFDAFGSGKQRLYKRLDQVASIAEVDSTQGSIFISGGVAYVHTINSRPADDDVMIHVDSEMLEVTGQETAYLENILFEGGLDGGYKSVGADGEHETYAVGCGFNYSQGGEGGVKAKGFGKFYTKYCVSYGNNQDGFNYKWDLSTANGSFLEDNCIAGFNGASTIATNDQGSTAHDGIKGVRVGGSYIGNASSGIGDITAGTQTWNVGITCGGNYTTISASNVSMVAFTDAELWLDYCVSQSGRFSMLADAGATIYVRGGSYDKPSTIVGNGVIKSRDDSTRDAFQGSIGDYYVSRDLYVSGLIQLSGSISGAETISAESLLLEKDETWFQTIDRTSNSLIDKLASIGVTASNTNDNVMVFGDTLTQFMQLGLSDPIAGNLTIEGTYSPFTGTHIYRSTSHIEPGLAVNLTSAQRKMFEYEEHTVTTEGTVELCDTEASKICCGVVESCYEREGEFIIVVAQVGDNRTNRLKGFSISEPVEAGDVLITSNQGRLKKSTGNEGVEVVKFKAMENQSDISKPVYGYFL